MIMTPEVLMYIQSLKIYFEKNKDVRDYFIGNSDEELFFEHLIEISKKNYKTNNDPMLTEVQFELLKKTISVLTISKKEFIEDDVFVEVKDFGFYCLN
jgi:hypothetical protein